ncbi:aldose epimerase family protein [Streptacidiphilus sp. MAP5-3]|uniref:aldose epimerase family protein n=1 Tax=unclassified Streptacidiphilus TaxID=2643834 RepID=UPI0035153A9F
MSPPALISSPFGSAPDGTPVTRWILDSGQGVRAAVLSYGAVLHELTVPDAEGRPASVVLNLPTVTQYAEVSPYFGAVVGRYANRIAHGRFSLDGHEHQVPVNDRGHALHGGPGGFHRRVWHARPGGPEGFHRRVRHARPGGTESGEVSLQLELRSPDGDMGFPGALDVGVRYTLDVAGTLRLDYTARTDRTTVLNLTHHAYFNLAGAGSGDVLGHWLALDSDAYLPVSPDAIPYGPSTPTAGTPFDFAEPTPLGRRITEDDPQLRDAEGYDHCWILEPPSTPGALSRAARLSDPGSGRCLEVWTTEPGIQVYTGNGLDGSLSGVEGKPYARHGAVCLETQHYPDSPNRPGYPSTVLRPGGRFTSSTEFRFPHLR